MKVLFCPAPTVKSGPVSLVTCDIPNRVAMNKSYWTGGIQLQFHTLELHCWEQLSAVVCTLTAHLQPGEHITTDFISCQKAKGSVLWYVTIPSDQNISSHLLGLNLDYPFIEESEVDRVWNDSQQIQHTVEISGSLFPVLTLINHYMWIW